MTRLLRKPGVAIATFTLGCLVYFLSGPELKAAEALIEGHFDAEASTGCWAPKFRIDAKKIELISPVTDYSPPAVEEEGLRAQTLTTLLQIFH